VAPFEYDDDRGIVISLTVADLDQSIDWYGKALGWELDYKLDEYGWCELNTANPTIKVGLGQSEELKTTGAVPTWRVKDIAAARAHLEGIGTRFDGETSEVPGMVRLATFFDPDGNPWMLAQVLATA
jgi:predicted enzyme related to lactoylglutathione lyase